MRRVPSQERGIERVDKLLTAAASVIAEVGVEAMTTSAITARAKTSVGSLYQFFPSKEAIISALASRYHRELRLINDTIAEMELAGLPLPDIVDRVMNPFIAFFVENPAYRHVYHAINKPASPSCDEAELHQLIVNRIEAVLSAYHPEWTRERQPLHAPLIVIASHALLSYAVTCDSATRDTVIDELKKMIVGYVDCSTIQ